MPADFDRKIVYSCFLALIHIWPIQAQPEKKIHPKEKPNIIFILTDDQRWDALGYSGNKIIYTPEMDKLANEGTYFLNGIVTTPICAASRASLITGLYERTHRYTFQTGPIQDQFMLQAYPVLLKQAGYYTGFFGKFGVKYNHLKSLFDQSDNYDRDDKMKDKRGYYYKTIGNDTVHLTRYTGQQALDFINDAPSNRPFCLQLSFSAPHAHDPSKDQYFWQPETDNLYQGITMPGPQIADNSFFNELPEGVKKGFSRLRWTWRFDTPEKYQESIKGYYRMIAGIDLEIARIRKALVQKGIDKNTVIILMGDNGYFLGERQLADKWLMYDNSIKVPLIILDPRVNKHRNVDDMALNIDIPATIIDLAGAIIPKTWHGKSLQNIVNGKESHIQNRDSILIEHLWEFADIPASEGVRTAEWKYFRYVNDKTLEYLYDLKNDPQEKVNLINKANYPNKKMAFRNTLERLIQKYKDPNHSNPIGLSVKISKSIIESNNNNPTPFFRWEKPSMSIRQAAYQILVASSIEKLHSNLVDLWNSGEVKNALSKEIEYLGTTLVTGRKYYWKVRIWDQDNRTSEYSNHGSFELSLPGK